VRLTERFGLGEAAEPVDVERGRARLEGEVAEVLKKRTARPLFAPHFLVGCGGTFTTLADLMMAAKRQGELPVAGYRVSQAEVRHLLDRLVKMPVRERRTLPGMMPDRADIIVAGLTIVAALMKRYRVNTLMVHTRGVRDGLLREMIDDSLGPRDEDEHRQRELAIERLAAACSGELEHGRAVAALAGRIFEQLVEPFGLPPGDRLLLECAARLQDVGYVINYDQHHKHSYHLIRNSRLPGIRAHDLELVANVARYHRGADPKRKHANLARLSSQEQQRVLRMAAILRLAGGLDRSRTQQVRDAVVRVREDGVRVEAVSDEDPQVDLWGAKRRVALFEKVFGVSIDVTWAGAEGPTPSGDASEEADQPERRRRKR
jgi:exopolyphosphatase/guanosine-5'-triphosphate,3'-diphosphate pyrophosphatase